VITDEPVAGARRAPTPHSTSADATRSALVRGALAIEPVVSDPPPVPDARRRTKDDAAGPLPLSRITTVHPRSYNEARTIGERYREGIPVILNLTELDDAAAKRLVDFAAGLAFALRGSIDKITNRVFLLSPSGVDVSAEDRRRLAERGFFGHD
jgi:cell division inhibitor SepF